MKIVISTYAVSDPSHPHFFKQEHLEAIKKSAGEGAEVIATTDNERAAREAADADIIAGFPFSLPPLTGAKNLKWLHAFSAGVDRVLTPETQDLPILISNSSGIHATPIAEHLLGFMLMFTRGFHKTMRNQLRHRWEKDETISELRSKTALIAGLGDIGMETARLAHAFGSRVIAVARGTHERPAFVDELATADALETLLPQADFVAICLPHTKKTHHLFNAEKFKIMKPTAVVMNIGRGSIIDERDLIKALKNKVIAGAALDVTETEPLPADSPLWDMENVIITPHHSGLSEKYMDRAVALFCRNMEAYRKGERLPTMVNKNLGY
ncbi:MAG: Uncharacterized protein Greene071436_114 [Parcubacteria group bacterium Greene0714_36]|nr:MAG: Uncharacterized protein Greene071436_114 [Parcubacteria group bacterium Greene0714_36]